MIHWKSSLFLITAGVIINATAQTAETPSHFMNAREELVKTWQVREHVQAMGTDTLGSKQLDRMLQLKSDLGLDAIGEATDALVRETNTDANNAAEVSAKLEYARKFSPNAPLIDLRSCELGWNPESVMTCWKGVRQEFDTFEGRLRFSHNLSISLIYALLCTFSVFAVLAALLNISALPNLFIHLIPSLSTRAACALSLLLILLGYLLFGILGLLGSLTILFWHRLQVSQKLSLGICMVLIAVSPLILIGSALKINYDRSIVPILETAMSKLNIEQNQKAMSRWAQTHPEDVLSKFNLARLEFRMGNYEKSLALYKEIEAIKPRWNKALHNSAIIYYKMGEVDKAEALLKDLSANFKSSKLFYNLGQIALTKTKLDEARELFQKSKELDPTGFYKEQQGAGAEKNLNLLTEALSTEDLAAAVWDKKSAIHRAQHELHAYFFPLLPLPRYWLFLFAIFILAIWTDFRHIKDVTSLAQKSRKTKSFDVFDPNASIVEVNSFDGIKSTLRSFSNQWVGFLVPGSHFFSRGQTFSAMMMTMSFATLFYFLFCQSKWLVFFPVSLSLPFYILLGILYAWNALSIMVGNR